MTDWILRQARFDDVSPLTNLAITDGRIIALAPQLSLTADQEWDLAGRVVIPGLVDAHIHLDKTYFPLHNQSGTLLEAIEVWRANKRSRTQAQIQAAVRRALQTAVANGVTATFLLNGFVQLNGGLGIVFSPGNDGIVHSILFALVGLAFYQYHRRTQPML